MVFMVKVNAAPSPLVFMVDAPQNSENVDGE